MFCDLRALAFVILCFVVPAANSAFAEATRFLGSGTNSKLWLDFSGAGDLEVDSTHTHDLTIDLVGGNLTSTINESIYSWSGTIQFALPQKSFVIDNLSIRYSDLTAPVVGTANPLHMNYLEGGVLSISGAMLSFGAETPVSTTVSQRANWIGDNRLTANFSDFPNTLGLGAGTSNSGGRYDLNLELEPGLTLNSVYLRSPGSALITAVPEPASAMPFAFACVVGALTRRRRK